MHSFGTLFAWNSQTVGGLSNIGGVELSASTQDSTTHQSANAYSTFDIGILSAGEVAISGFFDPTDNNGQLAMLTDFNNRTKRTAAITFPTATGTSWSFTAGITKLKVGDNPIDGQIPFTASLKIDGKPTLAVAASNNLSALSVSNSAVAQPAFSATTYEYVYTVLTGVSSVTITPTAAAGTITITANGASQTVTSAQASSAIALGSASSVTTVTITVQETAKSPKVYTLRITRA